jgi:hypothetical protein
MGDIDTVTTSNGVRLSGRQWIATAVFAVALFWGGPRVWERIEPLEFEPDYRVPYALSEDYWLYERWARLASERCDVMVVGDSVVWGHYVRRNETLSHFLNAAAGRERFANLGLDGLRQVVLEGLLRSYGRGVEGKKVLLHCNVLWMGSPREDLQVEEEVKFNHATLAPQFGREVPAYALRLPWEKMRADLDTRVGNVLERDLGFGAWTRHLQHVYYDRSSIPRWTVDHPRESPLRLLEAKLPPSDFDVHDDARPWRVRGLEAQEYEWVELESSVQWRFFKRAVELLRSRGNDVFVLVGPFNEHMIAERARPGYDRLKAGIEAWLRAEGVAYAAPATLPSDLWADASHPLAEGYRKLAEELARFEFFKGQVREPAAVRYVRLTPRGVVPECRFVVRADAAGWSIESVTGSLTVTARYGAGGMLVEAAAVLENGPEARVSVAEGRVRVTRPDAEPQEFDAPEGVIVTSAPDWTDVLRLCRLADRGKEGAQEFPGLWIHPRQPAQRLTFAIEKSGTATIEQSGRALELVRYALRLRGGSRYVAWVDAEGRMIKLVSLPFNERATVLALEGFEGSVGALGPE